MFPELLQLKRLSTKVGRDLTLTQGAGGNTSIKKDGVLWVKASGKWLANAEQEEMFLPVDLQRVRNSIPEGNNDANAATPLDGSPLRASIETSFHALLQQNVVVHVHSVNAISWAVQRHGCEALKELLEGLRWSWVPYARPGLPLTHLIAERMTRDVQVWILANHGLIVTGATVEQAEKLLEEIEQRLTIVPRKLPVSEIDLAPYCADCTWKLPKHSVAHQSALTIERARVAANGSLYPDQTVFIGPACAQLTPGNDISTALTRYHERWRMEAKVVVVEGAGLLVRTGASEGAEAMVACLGLVLERVDPFADIAFLDNEEVYGLMNWDAEKYRQSLTQN